MIPRYCEGSTLKVTVDNQACGLAAPGRQRWLTFGFGRLKKNCCARSGTLVSRFSSLVFKTAEKCDALLSVYCVDDTLLKFRLTLDTQACLLSHARIWSFVVHELTNINLYNLRQKTWTFWILVPFPEISSQFSIWMFHHRFWNCFKSLFWKSLHLCKFIAFSGRRNLIACLHSFGWLVSFLQNSHLDNEMVNAIFIHRKLLLNEMPGICLFLF